MRIEGEWFECDDGVVRPTVRAHVHGAAGIVERERFLIDTGADRTVLNADFLQRLQLAGDPPPVGFGLAGVGGETAVQIVRTVLELSGDDGRPALIRGELSAFTSPDATDLSILGRDVLDNFDVIISRRRDEVLLAPPHEYQVSPP
jgi:hypothetical protein